MARGRFLLFDYPTHIFTTVKYSKASSLTRRKRIKHGKGKAIPTAAGLAMAAVTGMVRLIWKSISIQVRFCLRIKFSVNLHCLASSVECC